jgi:hypothetical protein
LNVFLRGLEIAVNAVVDAINLLISAYNKIPFLGNIDKLKYVNYEIDLTAWKFGNAANAVQGYALSAEQAAYATSILDNELAALVGIPAIKELAGATDATDKFKSSLGGVGSSVPKEIPRKDFRPIGATSTKTCHRKIGCLRCRPDSLTGRGDSVGRPCPIRGMMR